MLLRKFKYVQGNQMPFRTKQHSWEIMKRLRLRNNFLRNRTEKNKILNIIDKGITAYLFCESLNKRVYYENVYKERNWYQTIFRNQWNLYLQTNHA